MILEALGKRFDVVVVGLGPTGATLANLLGICGLYVLVIDRFHTPYPLPRAVHFDDEIMRVFQTIGVADDVAGIVRVNLGMRFVDAAGNLLLDWPRPQEIGPQGWHASYRFHQPELEQILRRALNWYDNVEIRTGKEVRNVADRGDVVEISYDCGETGEETTVLADYVVGCDGANSIVRGAMNATETDLGFNERWLVADLLLKTQKPELGDHTIQFCNPDRPATYARGPGNRRRWEIAILDGEDAELMRKPDMVWKLLERWLSPDEAEMERAAVYTFQSIIADQWRTGRLLIAGDAAHRTPPFMGQGMCAGIRDASNLAWKLAATVRGQESADVLDSYGRERQPHAREYVETAIRLGRLINASGTEEALNAAFRQADGTVRMASIAPRLGPGLTFGSGPLVGTLFPQPELDDGSRLDDQAGYGPVLVVDGRLWGSMPAKIRNTDLFVLKTSQSRQAAGFLTSHDVKAVLVRPDRYISGTAGGATDLAKLLANVTQDP